MVIFGWAWTVKGNVETRPITNMSCRHREPIDELFSSPGVYAWERNEMISASLLHEAFPKAFRPIIFVTTSLLKEAETDFQSPIFPGVNAWARENTLSIIPFQTVVKRLRRS